MNGSTKNWLDQIKKSNEIGREQEKKMVWIKGMSNLTSEQRYEKENEGTY